MVIFLKIQVTVVRLQNFPLLMAQPWRLLTYVSLTWKVATTPSVTGPLDPSAINLI